MATDRFGTQQTTDADRQYGGSRFSDVRNAIFANPYQRVWRRGGVPPLPKYKVTVWSVLYGIIAGTGPHLFGRAAARTIDSRADLRWGYGGKGFRRLLHPNGVCLTGTWEITASTPYSGYFRQNSRALVIARYSTCCDRTCRGGTRSLSMVGKLFPTTDRDQPQPLKTANFITQQDIGGDWSDYINDAELLNAPNTTGWRRGIHIPVLIVTGLVFRRTDGDPTQRQLYPIAELDKPADEPTRAPAFLRLKVAESQPRVQGEGLDFRDEIMAQIYDESDPAPKRKLVFDIDVCDEAITRGPAIHLRRQFGRWERIGQMCFDESVVSYNGDHVIHFNHPTWRADRNDPGTATRVGEQRVR